MCILPSTAAFMTDCADSQVDSTFPIEMYFRDLRPHLEILLKESRAHSNTANCAPGDE